MKNKVLELLEQKVSDELGSKDVWHNRILVHMEILLQLGIHFTIQFYQVLGYLSD